MSTHTAAPKISFSQPLLKEMSTHTAAPKISFSQPLQKEMSRHTAVPKGQFLPALPEGDKHAHCSTQRSKGPFSPKFRPYRHTVREPHCQVCSTSSNHYPNRSQFFSQLLFEIVVFAFFFIFYLNLIILNNSQYCQINILQPTLLHPPLSNPYQ